MNMIIYYGILLILFYSGWFFAGLYKTFEKIWLTVTIAYLVIVSIFYTSAYNEKYAVWQLLLLTVIGALSNLLYRIGLVHRKLRNKGDE